MGDVVDLSKKRDENKPHTHGPVICLGCKHTWEGVVPINVDEVECPECHRVMGVRHTFTVPSDKRIWHCACGNNLFYVTAKHEFLCPVCGRHMNVEDMP